jgi:hypothetical protein
MPNRKKNLVFNNEKLSKTQGMGQSEPLGKKIPNFPKNKKRTLSQVLGRDAGPPNAAKGTAGNSANIMAEFKSITNNILRNKKKLKDEPMSFKTAMGQSKIQHFLGATQFDKKNLRNSKGLTLNHDEMFNYGTSVSQKTGPSGSKDARNFAMDSPSPAQKILNETLPAVSNQISILKSQ